MKTWQIIALIAVLLGASAFGVYWFFFRKKKSPSAGTYGVDSGYVVDQSGVVYLNGTVVGQDNGDDTWTSFGGAISDFNGNFIRNSDLTASQLVAVAQTATAAATKNGNGNGTTKTMTPADIVALAATLSASK